MIDRLIHPSLQLVRIPLLNNPGLCFHEYSRHYTGKEKTKGKRKIRFRYYLVYGILCFISLVSNLDGTSRTSNTLEIPIEFLMYL